MATSLLRLGRLASLKQCLQLENRAVLRSRSATWFCTRAEEPAKPAVSQMLAEAAEEELQAAAPAEPVDASEAAPEPDEPFDNSTYKNNQHHNYSSYTFSDLDVEMAKFRLPQPSSVRH
ncbi:NADH dehydrogenase [ubiquinone] flavoprotein 3, mitochondrial [Liparis tanakae]|uniref:NADH dehydrogenase [ubiquinone] flavoprotein 3, mitochondrial n=1 Tax=Liparis tanakae TaxID=230148 RepID=A0A4Z2G5K4_9TELE|nr:NADH dehydrogenase [ubiquinone] flavoprotein 3, mitochondrial [Liparis tanakae]